ncbi:MAG TPA: ABC transporter ATP-binding protein [Planctomycetaceae bacterium]|nr:ABC transporter ATP-binding protein [Planctomycetaceae bacterium]
MMNALELNDVSKSFGRVAALEHVSYAAAPGSVFALLGENGAGKTTTIRILLGLCEPDHGSATVLGLDSRRDDLKIRSMVGYVPEQPILYDWMTVEELGRFTASFYPDGFLKRYAELIAEYELPPCARIKTLSKGMRAKVSLALAVAPDPELLILDEPTSGLDALVRREFLEGMVDRAATGRTVFLSSHQIAEVERVADTVAIMKKSRVLTVEPLEALKANTRLLSLTFKEEASFRIPFATVLDTQWQGRDGRFLGRDLAEGAEQRLAADPNVARFELKTPSLEEIFVAYMQYAEGG